MIIGGRLISATAKPKTQQYFSLLEANRSLTYLTSRCSILLQMNELIAESMEKLQAEGFNIETDLDSALAVVESPIVLNILSDLCVQVPAAQALIDEVVACGIVPDVLTQGVFVWPAQHQDGQVLWCWQFGEAEITHWREAGASFDLRRRLDTLPEAQACVHVA